ncbi:MAG: hypothetical protein II828_10245 [Clostridia bacterium]|nr:hypothetical protein [Clostridia bacterium]
MKQKIKSALFAMLTLALISATAVAYTLAETSTNLDGKNNSFTNNPAIDVALGEPFWDSFKHGVAATSGQIPPDDSNTITPDTNTDDSVTSKKGNELGYNMAQRYKSGMEIPKNPSLKNTSSEAVNTFARAEGTATSATVQDLTSRDEWVAMKVTYKVTVPTEVYKQKASQTASADGSADHPYDVESASTLAGVKTYSEYDNGSNAGFKYALASINFNTTDWEDVSTDTKETFWQYKTNLSRDAITNPLFNKVTINTFSTANGKVVYVNDGTSTFKAFVLDLTGTGASTTTVYVKNLPDFEIDLAGYAVQADNLAAYTNATNELKSLAGLS